MVVTYAEYGIELRQLQSEDVDGEMVAAYNQSANVYFNQSADSYTVDKIAAYCAEGISKNNCFYYVASRNSSLVGYIRVGVVDLKHSVSDLVALVADPSQRGQGLGSKLIILGTRVAFSTHHIRKLHGGMFAANGASIAAYTKAGWFEEGRLVDHYLVDGKPMDRVLVSCLRDRWHR